MLKFLNANKFDCKINFIDELAIWLHWQFLIISFLPLILKSIHYNDSVGVLIWHRYFSVTNISGFSFLYNLPLELLLAPGSGNSSIVTLIDFFCNCFHLFYLKRITMFASFHWYIGVTLWRLLVFYLIHETVDTVHSNENFQPSWQSGQLKWICIRSFSQ